LISNSLPNGTVPVGLAVYQFGSIAPAAKEAQTVSLAGREGQLMLLETSFVIQIQQANCRIIAIRKLSN
jgi:hypothetical protein